MNNVELPIFAVARGEDFVQPNIDAPEQALIVFGDESSARSWLRKMCEHTGNMPSLYRIIRYNFSGKVMEG